MNRDELEKEIAELEEEICCIGSSIYNLEQEQYRLEMVLLGAKRDLLRLPYE